MDNKQNPLAGGFGIAIGAIAGSLIGAHYGQMSLGLLGGLTAGGVVATLVWVMDSKKN